jgi:polysaccharide biosynthesis protein PslH
MAMAKPVVATREATRALRVRSGAHLWIANHPRQFADALLFALKGSEREKIAQAGRDYVATHHNWQTLLTNLDIELEEVRRPLGSSRQNVLYQVSK